VEKEEGIRRRDYVADVTKETFTDEAPHIAENN